MQPSWAKIFIKQKIKKILLAKAQPMAGFGKGLQGHKEQKGTFFSPMADSKYSPAAAAKKFKYNNNKKTKT